MVDNACKDAMQVTVWPVRTQEENAALWNAKYEFFHRDIFPNCDIGAPLAQEDREYFLSREYRERIDALCSRENDRAFSAFFEQAGRRIGFCLYCTYLSEDGKCFILDFCVFPEYRSRGLGKRCFEALKALEDARGAKYYALNTHLSAACVFGRAWGFNKTALTSTGVC
jgi:GNAT superfamily N-acetyltransferase